MWSVDCDKHVIAFNVLTLIAEFQLCMTPRRCECSTTCLRRTGAESCFPTEESVSVPRVRLLNLSSVDD